MKPVEYRTPIKLVDLAARCRWIVQNTEARLRVKLTSSQRLDLVMDQIPEASSSDLKAALVVAGLTPPFDHRRTR